jgi:hypothetical protein
VAGVIGSVTVAVYKSYGFVPDPVFIWSTGNNLLLGSLLAALWAGMAAGAFWLDRDAWRGFVRRIGASTLGAHNMVRSGGLILISRVRQHISVPG